MQSVFSRAVGWFRNSDPNARRDRRCSVEVYRPAQGTFSKRRSVLRVREITVADFEEVAKLLGKGIGYSNRYFLELLQRMAHHPTPVGFPKYGRLLESDGSIVGAIILIFSTVWSNGLPSIRCHVTGWCVEPLYRCYAAVFFSRDFRHKHVTYLNISAKSDTLPIIEAQGFTRYSSGQFMAFPAIQFSARDSQAIVTGVDELPKAPFESSERDLLLRHAAYGCICFWVVTAERAYPFVFRPRLFRRVLPGVQLIYCRDTEDLVRFAGLIGRFLASRGRLMVRVDSNGPIRGLVGVFIDGMDSRYYKGPKPRLGDLAYTHLAMCAYVPRKKGLAKR